jgi:hypothetical protein
MPSTPRGAASDLTALLRTMEPELHDGVYVYSSVAPDHDLDGLAMIAMVRVREGMTVVVPEAEAVRAGLRIVFSRRVDHADGAFRSAGDPARGTELVIGQRGVVMTRCSTWATIDRPWWERQWFRGGRSSGEGQERTLAGWSGETAQHALQAYVELAPDHAEHAGEFVTAELQPSRELALHAGSDGVARRLKFIGNVASRERRAERTMSTSRPAKTGW